MARRRRGAKIDGWVILDKAQGLTSTQALGAVKRLVKPQKAGHGGTLDPLATGVLPIGLGEATKAMPYIVDTSKAYDFTLRWGVATDSHDSEGQITAGGGRVPGSDEIAAALPDFLGTILQAPPAFSAIKVDGARSYDLAREGTVIDLPPRPVEIDALTLLSHDGETSRLHLACGKGTYVRALARDLAARLDTYAHVIALRRVCVGPFDESQAISLEKLTALADKGAVEESILPVMTALADIPARAVMRSEADRVRQGQSLRLPTAQEGLVCLTAEGELVALADIQDGVAQPVRVFHLER